MKLITLSVVLILLLSACSTTSNSSIPSIEDPSLELISIKDHYQKQLSSIKVGDYINEIKEKFPALTLASDNMKNTIYEVNFEQAYQLKNSETVNKIQTYQQKIAFYFINKKLVHWQVIPIDLTI